MSQHNCTQERRIKGIEKRLDKLEQYKETRNRQDGFDQNRLEEIEDDLGKVITNMYISKTQILWIVAGVVASSAVTGVISVLLTTFIQNGGV